MTDLTGTITHSHDPAPPALPPLPEAILLIYEPSHPSERWRCCVCGTPEYVEDRQKFWSMHSGASTRIVTLTHPSSREVIDAEVAEIIAGALMIGPEATDEWIMSHYSTDARCVRAALTKGRGA